MTMTQNGFGELMLESHGAQRMLKQNIQALGA